MSKNFVLALAGVTCLFVTGCVGVDDKIDAVKKQAIAEMEQKAREVDAEKARIAAEVRRVQRDAEVRLKSLNANSEVEADQIKADVEAKAEGASAALAVFVAKRQSDVNAIKLAADASIAKLEAQNIALSQLGDLANSPIVSGLLGSLPGGGIIPLLVTAAVGYGVRGRSAKAADASWDEATKHVLTLMTPPPAVKPKEGV